MSGLRAKRKKLSTIQLPKDYAARSKRTCCQRHHFNETIS